MRYVGVLIIPAPDLVVLRCRGGNLYGLGIVLRRCASGHGHRSRGNGVRMRVEGLDQVVDLAGERLDIDQSAQLAAVQDDYISRSRLLDARLWVKRPFWHRIAERLFYFFSPLL